MISLHIAAIFGDEVITRCLLEDGYDLNIFEEVMRRPLFQTVAQSMRSIVELLLDYGTRIELADPGGINALHAALHQDTTDMLELLLQRDGDCNYQDLNFLTLLFRAVIDKKIEAARMLLKYNADPNIPDSTGFSPLFQCVATRDIPFVKLLLENGADPNAMVGMKQTTSVLPSESTTSTGNNNTNRPPIQHEFTCVPVRLQSQEADMSHSPISYAVRQGDEDLLKLLLSACENITWKDRRNFDEGLLHFAVRLGNNRIIDMPLEGGPEVLRNSTNGLGKTPLHIAAELGNMEAASVLVNSGCQVDHRERFRLTPLTEALWSGQLGMARLLLDYGADRSISDEFIYGMFDGMPIIMHVGVRSSFNHLHIVLAKLPRLSNLLEPR